MSDEAPDFDIPLEPSLAAAESIATAEHVTDGLSPEFFAIGLAAKYIGLTLYGICAIFVEAPSIAFVGGAIFAVLWAAVVTASGAAALAGVIRTMLTKRHRLEKWTTSILCFMFVIYAVALVVRGVTIGNMSTASLAWLPLIVTFFPMIRYLQLVRKDEMTRRAGVGHAALG
jgi:hypothetical protein